MLLLRQLKNCYFKKHETLLNKFILHNQNKTRNLWRQSITSMVRGTSMLWHSVEMCLTRDVGDWHAVIVEVTVLCRTSNGYVITTIISIMSAYLLFWDLQLSYSVLRYRHRMLQGVWSIWQSSVYTTLTRSPSTWKTQVNHHSAYWFTADTVINLFLPTYTWGLAFHRGDGTPTNLIPNVGLCPFLFGLLLFHSLSTFCQSIIQRLLLVHTSYSFFQTFLLI